MSASTSRDLFANLRLLLRPDDRHAQLLTVGMKCLRRKGGGRLNGEQAYDAALFALGLGLNVMSNAAVDNGDVTRRAKVFVTTADRLAHIRDTNTLAMHRPASSIMVALKTGNHPQAKRKAAHYASDKQLFASVGLYLMWLALEDPYCERREALFLDAAECIYGIAPLNSLGLGGTRGSWGDALRSAWPAIIRKHGERFAAKDAAAYLRQHSPEIELPAAQGTIDNLVSKLRREMNQPQ